MKTQNYKPDPNEAKVILQGIIVSNLFAMAAFSLTYLAIHFGDTLGSVLTFSEFVLVPIVMGIIASHFWIKVQEKLSRLFLPSLVNTVIAILLSAIFMGEGVICLIIVSPLILAFMWVGVVIGRNMFINKNNTLKASTFLIFLGLFVYDTFSEHNYTNIVSDELTINARRDVVWKYVASHPLNNEDPDYWLFKVGLPCPVQSTVSGTALGSRRKCIFSNNAVFDEVVTESIADSLFTFDITKQPEDPEIIGHIEIQKGQFLLKDNGDGTTQLIGNSWYKLRVYPVWYYDYWAVDITRNVHLRVMNHIKRLAEKDV